MSPPTGIFQIRGPDAQPQGLVGPIVLIAGDEAPPGVTSTLLEACFDALAGGNPDQVGILMAGEGDKAKLASRWPKDPSPTAGWLVGPNTSVAKLRQAFTDAGAAGQPLRVLVAENVQVRDALAVAWDSTTP